MTTHSDDEDMTQPLDERAIDALLSGRQVEGEELLSAVVAELLALTAAPVPSPALAAVLRDGLTPDATSVPGLPRMRRGRRLLPLPLAAGTALAVCGVFGAASANALPAPAQRIVSDTVSSLIPVHLPKPASHPTPTPSESPSQRPAPRAVVPTRPERAEPSRRPERSPGAKQGDGHGRGDGVDRRGPDVTASARPEGTPRPTEHDGREGSHQQSDGGHPGETGH
ncbi:MAG: hypothetical protein ABR549_14425 [Mycobacteriales bacterium]